MQKQILCIFKLWSFICGGVFVLIPSRNKRDTSRRFHTQKKVHSVWGGGGLLKIAAAFKFFTRGLQRWVGGRGEIVEFPFNLPSSNCFCTPLLFIPTLKIANRNYQGDKSVKVGDVQFPQRRGSSKSIV